VRKFYLETKLDSEKVMFV